MPYARDLYILHAADGAQYMRDLGMTLCYFLQAYPPGSQLLLQGQAGMVTHLTTLHDDLIPQMANCLAEAVQQQQSQATQVGTCLDKHASSTLLLLFCLMYTPRRQCDQITLESQEA